MNAADGILLGVLIGLALSLGIQLLYRDPVPVLDAEATDVLDRAVSL